MVHLIDKNSLVAEIEKLNYIIMPYPTMAEKTAYRDGIRDTINILIKFPEVKEVDLENDVDKILEANDWNFDKIDFYKFAKHFFELGLKAQKI